MGYQEGRVFNYNNANNIPSPNISIINGAVVSLNATVNDLSSNIQNTQNDLNTIKSKSTVNSDTFQLSHLISLTIDIKDAYLKIITGMAYIIKYIIQIIRKQSTVTSLITDYCGSNPNYDFKLNLFELTDTGDIDMPISLSLLFTEDIELLSRVSTDNLIESYKKYISSDNNNVDTNISNSGYKFSNFIYGDTQYINVNIVLTIFNTGLKPLLFNICFENPNPLNSYFSSTSFNAYLDKIILTMKNTVLIPLTITQLTDSNTLKYIDTVEHLSATIFELGNIGEFDNLKVLVSLTNPFWNGKLIQDCFITNPQINIFDAVSGILFDFNKNIINFAYSPSPINLTTYYLGDQFYLACGRRCNVDNKTYIIINNININKYFDTAIKMNGDVNIDGNLKIKNLNTTIMSVDTNRKTLSLDGRIGINKKSYETKGLIDIHNISVEEILVLLDNLTDTLVNSHDVSNLILTKNLYTTDLPALFLPNGELFDYKNQVQVFEFDLYSQSASNVYLNPNIFALRHIRNIYNNTSITFNNDVFLKRIQNIFVETSNAIPEFNKIYNKTNTMTFFELIQDDNQLWYIASIKGIILNSYENDTTYLKMICVMDLYDVTNFMINNSQNSTFVDIINYYSSIYYFLNYASLLIKDTSVFTNVLNGNMNYITTQIASNRHFYHRCGLLEDSYLQTFTHEPENQMCLFNESYPQFNGKRSKQLWIGDYTVDSINQQTYNHFVKLYNTRLHTIFPVYYLWDGKRVVSFQYIFVMNGVTYRLSSGIAINTLLPQSIITQGDTNLFGELYVSNPNGETVFKVNNIDKCVYNAYNLGVGVDNPDSVLHIKDTTVQNMINQTSNSSNIINNMNIIKQLLKNTSEPNFISSINTVIDNNANYLIYKIDTTSMLAKDITIIYDSNYSNFNGKTIAQALIAYPNNNIELNTINDIYQNVLDSEPIYDGSLIVFTQSYIINVSEFSIICFKNNSNLYFLININSIQEFNIRYFTNKNIINFFNTKRFSIMNLNDIYRRMYNITNTYNLIEGTNLLNKLFKPLNTYTINIHINTFDFSISNIDITSLAITNTISFSNIDYNEKIKMLYFMNNLKNIYDITSIKQQDYLLLTYEDQNLDYFGSCLCTSKNTDTITLIVCESVIQNIMHNAVLIEGDTEITGDLIINNTETNTNYMSVDPIQQFVGIGTDNRVTNYSSMKYTSISNGLKDNLNLSNHNLHVYREKYPVSVCNRVQENINDTKDANNINPRYFGTYSTYTARRSSKLYTFDEMYQNASLLQSTVTDPVTNFKYGPDISFEVSDKNQNCVELGEIQMTIDKIDSNGNLRGGFGVQVLDAGANFEDSRRNIMYVNNDGTLFINKIVLKGKELSVDSNNNLTWGGQIVNLE